MNKKISLGAAIAFMLVVATLTLALTMVYSMNRFTTMVNDAQEQRKTYQKLAEIDRTVREKYPDAVDSNKVMDSIAAGYLAGLSDDNSRYYTAEEYQSILSGDEGRYYGIGIVPTMEPSGYIQVKEVYPESPALNAQIVEGDMIVKVNDLDVTTETYEEAVMLLRGEAGTKVSLVLRRGTEDVTMEITYRQVDIPTVYAKTFDQVAYLNIRRFTTATRDQFNKQLNQVIGSDLKALIIDLRENTGGRYSSMAPVLDLLVPKGDIIYARYKDGKDTVLYSATTAGVDLPIVVLTNENTTGTAELFAQVLKDTNKSKTVGAKTAGQGKLQETLKLDDGSALLLTVGRFVSPSGVVFDGEGVKADYEVKLEAEAIDWNNIDVSLDSQLAKAMELAVANIKVENVVSETTPDTSEAE